MHLLLFIAPGTRRTQALHAVRCRTLLITPSVRCCTTVGCASPIYRSAHRSPANRLYASPTWRRWLASSRVHGCTLHQRVKGVAWSLAIPHVYGHPPQSSRHFACRGPSSGRACARGMVVYWNRQGVSRRRPASRAAASPDASLSVWLRVARGLQGVRRGPAPR